MSFMFFDVFYVVCWAVSHDAQTHKRLQTASLNAKRCMHLYFLPLHTKFFFPHSRVMHCRCARAVKCASHWGKHGLAGQSPGRTWHPSAGSLWMPTYLRGRVGGGEGIWTDARAHIYTSRTAISHTRASSEMRMSAAHVKMNIPLKVNT